MLRPPSPLFIPWNEKNISFINLFLICLEISQLSSVPNVDYYYSIRSSIISVYWRVWKSWRMARQGPCFHCGVGGDCFLNWSLMYFIFVLQDTLSFHLCFNWLTRKNKPKGQNCFFIKKMVKYFGIYDHQLRVIYYFIIEVIYFIIEVIYYFNI